MITPITMHCLCGKRIDLLPLMEMLPNRWVRRAAACLKCQEVYDYVCRKTGTTSRTKRPVFRIEAYPRGVTQKGVDIAGRCAECDACQEWLLAPAQGPECSGQEYRRRGIVEKVAV
jgi:hypothetical protein